MAVSKKSAAIHRASVYNDPDRPEEKERGQYQANAELTRRRYRHDEILDMRRIEREQNLEDL